ncbi:MAG: multidrug DMT transporter permease [Bacteroidales bacterium]|nr:multidrug DMT transporter permease [Bacteroidales bacterium]
MYIVGNYALAVFFTVITMVCWGSWPNTQVLVKGWRFELYYWDYVIGILMVSLLMAFTLGSFGSEGRDFITDLQQANLKYILFASFGGFIWSTGTLLIVAGIAIAGMSVAFPIGGGIGWIFGIITSYLVRPEGNPLYLFIGTAFIFGAIIVNMMSYRQMTKANKKAPLKGIVISVLAGICLAFFYSFVARSLDTDFTLANSGKLTAYSAVVFFSVGALVSAIVFNPFFMRRPVQGQPVGLKDYLKGTFREHSAGILGGLIFGLGNSLSFMAANVASPAISYALSNGAVIVAALWGIFYWKEFKSAPKGTNLMLVFMFVFYLIGLTLIVFAKF